jgi:hypothetical protein
MHGFFRRIAARLYEKQSNTRQVEVRIRLLSLFATLHMNRCAAWLLVLVFAVVSVAAFGLHDTHAAELPGPSELESLTVEEARRLVAEYKGEMLSLGGLTTLDAETAKALAEYKGDYLSLDGLATLNADTAKALAESKARRLHLKGLATLDADTAKALAEYKGDYISLDGLATLNADTAKALAEYKGRWLYLNGLATLDSDTAKALATYECDYLFLSCLTTLSLTPDSASAWVRLLRGNLSAVTALESPDSVAIAKALATAKGPLVLSNLKKISPKTLSALIEKEDIDIPLIETLELIPEPDGSPTEDFVIPEAFQKN